MKINKFIKSVVAVVLTILFWPVKYMIPKKDIILMHCSGFDIYCDNTRFLFEYLSTNTDYKVFWLTTNRTIKEYLSNNGYKYADPKKIFSIVWLMLRTRIVFDSGDSYFNLFKLSDNNKTVKISTMHGSGLKTAHMRTDDLNRTLLPITRLNSFDYCNFTSKYACTWVAKRLYLLPTKKILQLGYPRCDFFFDLNFVSERYKKKKLVKELNPSFDINEGKVILYTPTWRPYDYKLPILGMKGFTVERFNDWLKKHNYFFFYTSHTANIPSSRLSNMSNFSFVNRQKHPLFDINLFMLETDLLLNDYSTISTEFSILKRPQVFYMHDFEYFEEEKGFVEDYKSFLPGKEVETFDELCETVDEYLKTPQNYLRKYEKNNNILLEKYYDTSQVNSCTSFVEIVKKIIESQNRIELVSTHHLKKNI